MEFKFSNKFFFSLRLLFMYISSFMCNFFTIKWDIVKFFSNGNNFSMLINLYFEFKSKLILDWISLKSSVICSSNLNFSKFPEKFFVSIVDNFIFRFISCEFIFFWISSNSLSFFSYSISILEVLLSMNFISFFKFSICKYNNFI